MTFIPVIELSASRVPVGITNGAQWVYLSRDGELLSLEVDPKPFMVTILQQGETFWVALSQGLAAAGLDEGLAATFPVHVGVRLGLTCGSDQWETLAVQWLEREGSAVQFLPELESLAVQGRTQRTRHAARRLARRADRTASR